MLLNRVAIIGVGLMGGSFGLAINHRNIVSEVIGYDNDKENIAMALSAGAIHWAADTCAEAVKGADLVVLATPVLTTETLLRQLALHIDKNTVVTDVGSTKVGITSLAEEILPEGVHFVGGHPMAGSEVAGMGGAHPYLFENAYYLLTPTVNTHRGAVDALRNLVEAMGAKVVIMTPEKHDATVAVVSHLPHLVAAALVNTLDGMPCCKEMIPFAAGGFRDTTRIAAGSPVMWRDIFLSNNKEVLEILNSFQRVIDDYKELITANDSVGLQHRLNQAKETRLSLPARSKGYLPALYEILLTVPDKPGVIAHFAALLGENGVNITELEILRVREGQGGTIRLSFATEEEQKQAVDLLVGVGYQAHVR